MNPVSRKKNWRERNSTYYTIKLTGLLKAGFFFIFKYIKFDKC